MQIQAGRLFVFSGLALTVALVLGACGEKAQNKPAGGPPAVTVITVQPEPVATTTELPGRIAPYLIAEVRPQVDGIVRQRLFKEGTDVKAGQTLYQIEPATYQAEYDSARAGLARAEANMEVARLKAQRYAGLMQTHAVSQQDHDEAQAALKQAQAEVAAAQATLDKAGVELDFTRVAAPVAGRIGRSAVTVGALVTENQPAALATVQQLDPIYVDLTQSSAELLRLKRDVEAGRLQRNADSTLPVKLTLEDGSLYAAEGRLAFSEATVDPTTGSVTLRAVFPNPKHELLPGMYVRARLALGTRQNAILVPHAALSRNPRGQAQVMLVNAENKVEARLVQAEQSAGDKWVVTEGLVKGERVIIEGLQRARPGSPVQAQEAGTAPAPPAAAAR